jgi:hypothetical protein
MVMLIPHVCYWYSLTRHSPQHWSVHLLESLHSTTIHWAKHTTVVAHSVHLHSCCPSRRVLHMSLPQSKVMLQVLQLNQLSHDHPCRLRPRCSRTSMQVHWRGWYYRRPSVQCQQNCSTCTPHSRTTDARSTLAIVCSIRFTNSQLPLSLKTTFFFLLNDHAQMRSCLACCRGNLHPGHLLDCLAECSRFFEVSNCSPKLAARCRWLLPLRPLIFSEPAVLSCKLDAKTSVTGY